MSDAAEVHSTETSGAPRSRWEPFCCRTVLAAALVLPGCTAETPGVELADEDRAALASLGYVANELRESGGADPEKKVLVLGIDGMDWLITVAHDGRGQASQLPGARRRGRVQLAAVEHSASEPRGVVELHNGRGPGRPRHLRLHAPRHGDVSSVSLDVAGRSTRRRRRACSAFRSRTGSPCRSPTTCSRWRAAGP